MHHFMAGIVPEEGGRPVVHLWDGECLFGLYDAQEKAWRHLESDKAPGSPEAMHDRLLLAWETRTVAPLTLFLHRPEASLAPEKMTGSLRAEELFHLSYTPREGMTLRQDAIASLEAALLYRLPEDELRAWEARFPGLTIMHGATPWLEGIRRVYGAEEEARVHMEVHEGFVYIAAWRERALQLFNVFPTGSVEDVLYFLTFVTEELRFHPRHDRYILSGDIAQEGELHRLLAKYFQRIVFQEKPAFYRYPPLPAEAEEHSLFTFLSSPLCAS